MQRDALRVDATLKEADDLFCAVFAEASDGMLLLDPARHIVEANPAASLLFGLTVDGLKQHRLDDLLGEAAHDLDALWSAVLTSGKLSRSHNLATPGHDVRVVDCRYRTAIEGHRHLCIARDTTERRRLEERLVHAEKTDSLGRLAGGIAHDFNNLLTTILGYTTLLLDDRPDAANRAELEHIQQAGEQAAVLTQQLLVYSRKHALAPREIDLNHAVMNLHAMLTRLIREDISLRCEPCPLAAVMRIDPTQLQQTIINLVLNARDAIPAEGTIHLTVARVPASKLSVPADLQPRAQEYVELKVTDDGVGIPAEARAHLFEPFFAPRDAWRGTGLGLASVYEIVRQSHGFIQVDSELGRGTTFEMYFPAVEPATLSDEPPFPEADRSRTLARETILLVEDEDAVRLIASTILRRNGYRVLRASTPREACDLFELHTDAIDLLLTDVVMPELNGPGLAQRLVAIRPKLRVLFMSGYADIESPFDMGNPNVSFLAKPFQAAGLLNKVKAVLAKQHVAL